MIKRLMSAIGYDLRLQFRHKFYHVYAIITVLYVAALRFLPLGIKDVLLPVLIFSDPAMLGFYFVAALVLFEKDARSLQAIGASPLRPKEYILSKAISLSVLSVLASVALALGVRGANVQWPLLVLGVGLTGMIYVTIGFILTVKHETFSTFLLQSILATAILNLPLLGVFNVVKSPLFYLLPAQPAILLIMESFQTRPSLPQAMLHLLVLVAWNILLLHIGERRYLRYVKGD